MRTPFACFCLIASLIQPAELFAEEAKQDPPAVNPNGADRVLAPSVPTPAMLVHAREMSQARQRMARLAARKWSRVAAPAPYFSNDDYLGYFYPGYRRPTPYPPYGPFPLYGAAADPERKTSSGSR